jgi:hypothetical protein
VFQHTALLSTVDTLCVIIPVAKAMKTPYLENIFQIGYSSGSIIAMLQHTVLFSTVDTPCLIIPVAKAMKTPLYLEYAFQIGYL